MRKKHIALAAGIAAMWATPAAAGVLGSTEVTDCLVGDLVIECEQQTVTTFTVSYGLSAEADLAVLDPYDPTKIAFVAKVELSKSQPTVTYPLIYHHSVDFHPREAPGALLFDGYRIGEPVTDYVVRGKVTQGATVHDFQLSPEDPVHALAAVALRAELVGDFAAYKGLPELDNFILYIPASPATHPYVEFWQENMLLVPREEVSYEGTECDKVGYIPRTRFARKYGLCLKNQLFDKHSADLERLILNPDVDAAYLVRGMRAFKRTQWFETRTGTKLLSYEPPEIQNTQVAVTTDRVGSVKAITTESEGIIAMAEVLVDPFDSHSRDGTLRVDILNIGGIEADYLVEVTNCDNIVAAIPAQARTVEPSPYATIPLFFDLYTTSSSGVIDNSCTVTLESPRGRIYDQREVFFDTADNPAPMP